MLRDALKQKLTVIRRMSIIIRIITGALQDADDNSYRRVVQVYLVLAAGAAVVGTAILIGSFFTDNLALLQWTRQKRLTSGAEIIERIRERSLVTEYRRTRIISIISFGALIVLTLGSWAAYIWGAITGHNS
jgi:ABC-type transport system involved in cytochrome c biogenesis permease subunit